MSSPTRRDILAVVAAGGAAMTGAGIVFAVNAGDSTSPPPADATIETTATGCAERSPDTATVEIDHDVAHIDGVLEAPTPCHDAVLVSVSENDGILEVAIDTESRESEDLNCIQCVGEIGYSASIHLEEPAELYEVVVVHADGPTFTLDA